MKKLHTFLLAAAVFLAAAALCFSLCRVGAGENVIVRHVSDAEINSLVNDVQLIREIVNFLNQYTSGNQINNRQVSNLIQKCSLSGN